MNKDYRLYFTQPDKKSSNLTVYGLISEKKGLFYYSVEENTSIVSFKHFIEVLTKEKCILKNSILVLDNHSSHRSNEM